ncbi:hypothetical protein QFC20_006812 [Naganishia adeliensis]|uniref:Uncharacterized protein n=1 Tax=Naganishia adeliensis TaxID=92952 RepID=A0ACC2V6P2_9TREE|nr:hypothetical protein QFC20_006812 [Naganishia adeliensis]
MILEASPEPIFLGKMKDVINKLEWEVGHCMRLRTGIEWGLQNGRMGLVEGATDKLLEMQAEILVDLEIGQKLAFEVSEFLRLGTEVKSSVGPQQQMISPLQSYLCRMDVFRSHVRCCLEEDIEKDLVIPGEKARL